MAKKKETNGAFNPVIQSNSKESLTAKSFVSPKHPKSICIVNYKGGTGKTTITCLLGWFLSALSEKTNKKLKILLLDIDPQCSLSLAVGFDPEAVNKTDFTIFNMVKPERWSKITKLKSRQYIKKAPDPMAPRGLFVIPGSFDTDDLDMKIAMSIATDGEKRKDELFLYCKQLIYSFLNYDYVLVDCPPNKMFLTQAMLRACSYYLPVTIPDGISIYGMPRLMRWVKQIHKSERPLMLGYVLNAINRAGGVPGGKVYSQQGSEQDLLVSIFNDLLPEEKVVLGKNPLIGVLPRLDRVAKFLSQRGGKTAWHEFSEKTSGQPTVEDCLVDMVKILTSRIRGYRAQIRKNP